MKKILLAGSILGGLFTPQIAFAQTAPNAASAEAQAAESGGLNTITVTAQRREESLQDAPIAITAIAGADLASAGISTAADLSGLVPALEIQPAASGKANFYLRGVGGLTGNSLSDPAVAFNFNDVYISRPQGTGGHFFDLDRVEVLKGPQGTLYGRNATGGAINVIPARPQVGEVSGYATAAYGNYDHVQAEGALNLPLGDRAALRAAASYVKHDGYMSDGTSDQDDLSTRLSLRLEPSDIVNITIVGDYFRGRGLGTGSTIISNTGGRFTLDDRVGLGDPRAQAVYASTYVFPAGNTLRGLPTNTQFVHNDNFGISATINVETSLGQLTFIPAYRNNDGSSVTFSPGFYIAEQSSNDQFSAELRLASDDTERLSYILGAYYFDDAGDTPVFNTNSQYNASFQSFDYSSQSYAGFARLNYNVTEDLTLTLGGRYTSEERAFSGVNQTVNRFCLIPPFTFSQCPGAPNFAFGLTSIPSAFINLSGNGVLPFPLAGGTAAFVEGFDPDRFQVQLYTRIANDSSATFDKFTWRVGADYDLTPDNMLYASFETGFKSGGFFFSPTTNIYQPETIDAFTLGSKNSFMGNTVRLNLEAFYWTYQDQQVSHLGSALPPGSTQPVTIFPTENVGRAVFKGIEIEAEAMATDTTRLGATVQYLDAEYKSFVYNVPSNSPPQTGCRTASTGAATIGLDCSGFRPPNAPEWVVRLSGEQTFPLGNGADIVLDTSATFQSETLAGLEFLPVELQADYWLVDANLTYRAPSDRFFISAYVRNMFNETVFTNAFPPPLTSGLFVAPLRAPRTYGVRAGFNF